MDNRKWNDWDVRCPHKEDSTQNPYYNQPTHSPYRGQGFAIACTVFGILSMLSGCLLVAPFICAAFSFLFASLAYRKGRRRPNLLTYGITASVFGIISALILLIQSFSALQSTMQESGYTGWMQPFIEMQQ